MLNINHYTTGVTRFLAGDAKSLVADTIRAILAQRSLMAADIWRWHPASSPPDYRQLCRALGRIDMEALERGFLQTVAETVPDTVGIFPDFDFYGPARFGIQAKGFTFSATLLTGDNAIPLFWQTIRYPMFADARQRCLRDLVTQIEPVFPQTPWLMSRTFGHSSFLAISVEQEAPIILSPRPRTRLLADDGQEIAVEDMLGCLGMILRPSPRPDVRCAWVPDFRIGNNGDDLSETLRLKQWCALAVENRQGKQLLLLTTKHIDSMNGAMEIYDAYMATNRGSSLLRWRATSLFRSHHRNTPLNQALEQLGTIAHASMVLADPFPRRFRRASRAA